MLYEKYEYYIKILFWHGLLSLFHIHKFINFSKKRKHAMELKSTVTRSKSKKLNSNCVPYT